MKKIGVEHVLILVVVGAVVLIGKRLFSMGGLFSQAGAVSADKQGKAMDQAVVVESKNVTKTPIQIKNVADSLYQAMEDAVGVPFDLGLNKTLLFDSLKGLNPDELKSVYKQFATRESSVFGFTVFSGNLVNWFNAVLSGSDLSKMKQIWAPTLLWV